MKRLSLSALCLLSLSACAPSSILIPDGNGFIELTQTRHILENNGVSIGHCDVAENDKCPPGTPKHLYVTTGPGWALAGSTIQAAGMVGAGQLIGAGLAKSGSNVNQAQNNATSVAAPPAPVKKFHH